MTRFRNGRASDPRRVFPAAVMLAALCALAVCPPPGAAQAGGSIANAAPNVETWNHTAGSSIMQGTADVFFGVVFDANGEADIATVRLVAAGAADFAVERAIAPADLAAASEPEAFDADGWKIWNPTDGDGRLNVSRRVTHATPGVTVWLLGVKDEGAWVNATTNVTVTVQPAGGGGGGGGGFSSGTDDGQPPQDPQDGQNPTPDPPSFDGDVTDSLGITMDGADAVLTWPEPPVPGFNGFLVWRSTSPWALVADLPPETRSYRDPSPPPNARYRLTIYMDRNPEAGYVDSPEEMPNWSESLFRELPPGSSSVLGPDAGATTGSALAWLVFGGLAVVVGTVAAVAAPPGSLAAARQRSRAWARASAQAIRHRFRRRVVDEHYEEDASDPLIEHLERIQAEGQLGQDDGKERAEDAKQEHQTR